MAELGEHSPSDAPYAHRFAAYLRAFPEVSADILRYLSVLDDSGASLLFNILELAGTPEAQEVLVAIAQNPSYGADRRFQALVAIAGIGGPSAELLDALRRLAQSPFTTGEDPGLATTALLTLGTLASATPPEQHQILVTELLDGLAAEFETSRRVAYLSALRNSKAAIAIDELRSALDATEPEVRAAATKLIAVQATPAATAELTARVAQDPAPAVRAAAVEGLGRQTPSATANEVVADLLANGREANAGVRARMVVYLASQMERFPENRELLEGELKRENDRTVIVAILNSLGPDTSERGNSIR